MLGRERFFLAQFQHLFDRSNFFCHDDHVRRLFFSARVAFATLVSGFQNSRYFPNEISIAVWYIPEAEEIRREWARSIIQKIPMSRTRSIHRAQTNAFTID